MIILKSEKFALHSRLVRFVNENNIKREDILTITDGPQSVVLYFYADSETEEITHGLFS
ncbi:hypothetical protein [Mucilaginibacter flavus]|uniref:hypothetical protein n=1 Tax=Mucilaginibacter flavus TaxID=931504 RepID=UPI0025B47F60|nr:hypothetical protein [Mucilaginibacter flavus]MDN3581447.1 hypothetical protein [Mucilaginibacter flavus]